MSSDENEEKPPAPPLRLTSNRGSEAVSLPVDMRPLPKEPETESTSSKSSFWLGGGSKKAQKEIEKPNISYPSKFKHVVHVGFDPDTGEFTGMPEAWARLLISSNISREMQLKNPQAVLDVLNYYESSAKGDKVDKFMQPSSSPLSSSNNNLRSSGGSPGAIAAPGMPPVPPVRHHHHHKSQQQTIMLQNIQANQQNVMGSLQSPLKTSSNAVPTSNSGHSLSSNHSIKSNESATAKIEEDLLKNLEVSSIYLFLLPSSRNWIRMFVLYSKIASKAILQLSFRSTFVSMILPLRKIILFEKI